jgi:hypothetical protein
MKRRRAIRKWQAAFAALLLALLGASCGGGNSPLAGTGTGPASQHLVDLSWTASTSTVMGYYIYRGTSSGGPYTRLNSTLDAATAYSDSTVQSDNTYYYVVTSVDSNLVESTYSNEVVATVPTP